MVPLLVKAEPIPLRIPAAGKTETGAGRNDQKFQRYAYIFL